MDNAEARSILKIELAKYRTKGYRQLAALIGHPQTIEVAAPSGTRYQLEIQALWDDPRKSGRVLRVAAAIDDRGGRTYAPLTDSFLLAPTGEFVGE